MHPRLQWYSVSLQQEERKHKIQPFGKACVHHGQRVHNEARGAMCSVTERATLKQTKSCTLSLK